MASTSLIHETDLVVSINDLDNLFNSDEDDLAVSRDLQLTQLHVFCSQILSAFHEHVRPFRQQYYDLTSLFVSTAWFKTTSEWNR